MTPTAEQLAIIDAAKTTTDNLVINALAGAAKTTTLELICRALPVQPILSLAFNKRIADEMKKRLPGHVNAATINSVGHRIWAQACAKRLIVSTDKTYKTLKVFVDGLRSDRRRDAYDSFSETRKAISTAKLNGYVPHGTHPHAKRLLTQDEFYENFFDEELPGFQIDLIEKTLNSSIVDAYAGQIDFDDQIYMPTLFGGTFPRFPLVMVDEAQDLSPLNHAMLEKTVTNRIIAVGDPYQSIYAFRGAAINSMGLLRERFSCREMNLSISFRCPIEIVKRARSRAPHMQWAETATEGAVHEPVQWNAASIPDNAAIICRNNAPLFKLAFILLRNGRGVHLVGRDIDPGLIKALKALGSEDMTCDEALAAIDQWETAASTKSKNKGNVADKADALRVFVGQGSCLRDGITYAEHLFQSQGPIQLLSGHKAKGLEWDVVYHLDPDRIPSPWAEGAEELEQERNIRYVIETRAKKELHLVYLDDFQATVA